MCATSEVVGEGEGEGEGVGVGVGVGEVEEVGGGEGWRKGKCAIKSKRNLDRRSSMSFL